MQSLNIAKKLLPGVLFLLAALFASPPPCAAITIEVIYADDNTGEGFDDGTALEDALKNSLSMRGNDADTLGEARKNAFEHAVSDLEGRLVSTRTISVRVEFKIFTGQENPANPDECRTLSPPYVIAGAGPWGYGYRGSRLIEGDASNPGLGTAYPYALIETLLDREFSGQNPDIFIEFSKCASFYYGITERAPPGQVDFVATVLHEFMHGLGFTDELKQDGSFKEPTIPVTEIIGGIPIITRRIVIESRSIYDEQLYSESDDDLLTDLTNSQRAAAITSDTGLLWEGTDGGRNPCSYGQRMAELKTSSAKSQDGKPLLYAPPTYEGGGSIIHTHDNSEDVMEAFSPAPRNMDLSLGMLRDMGWSINADGFPPGCEPTGITVRAGSGLVTTEAGGEVTLEVSLESEPLENVVIPLANSDTSEGRLSASELTFTPGNWDAPQEVTVTGVDDDIEDGPQNYLITLGAAQSNDRFYRDFIPQPQVVSLRNDDNDRAGLRIQNARAQEGNPLNFAVTLRPLSARTVSVRYEVTDGTAEEGSDYTASPRSGTLSFVPGDSRETVSVLSIDDNTPEAAETFTVTLSSPQNAALGRARATGTIEDNDQPPPPPPVQPPPPPVQPPPPPVQPPPPPVQQLPPAVTASFGSSSYGVTEGGTVTVRVTLSADPERNVTIPIAVSVEETTAEANDYSPLPESVRFASGETSKSLSLVSENDDAVEDAEVVVLVFGVLPERVSEGAHASATVTIRDATPPPPPPPGEAGGGGCSLVAGADHGTERFAANLLLAAAVLSSVFLPKTRPGGRALGGGRS